MPIKYHLEIGESRRLLIFRQRTKLKGGKSDDGQPKEKMSGCVMFIFLYASHLSRLKLDNTPVSYISSTIRTLFALLSP